MAAPTIAPTEEPLAPASPPVRGISLATLGGLVVTVAGLFIGLQPLRDNSFLTHLATGRLILETGSVPSADPYSFTAHGEAWTVQSWLASVLYAGAEELAGYVGIRVLIVLTTAVLAYLIWRLTEPAGAVVARVALALPVLVIGSDQWSERPMLFGLVGLASVWLLADGKGRAWYAVPIFWAWVNLHGSFPLGGLLLVCLAAGTWLDRRSPRRELQVLGWAVVGILAGGINPVGPRLIVFPLELLSKTEALSTIKEWRPPDYADLGPQVLLILAVVTVALFVRRRTFRQVIPAVVFLAMALLGARNIGPASIVLLAAVAPSLRGIGSDVGDEPRPVLRLAALAVGVVAAIAALGSLQGPDTDLVGYPTQAVAWMAGEGMVDVDDRIVSRDFAGNYLEARYGTEVRVFMDDRYDMFPIEVIRDYRVLLEADPEWPEVLARWDADAVLWDREAELFDEIEASDDWRVAYEDDTWAVFLPA